MDFLLGGSSEAPFPMIPAKHVTKIYEPTIYSDKPKSTARNPYLQWKPNIYNKNMLKTRAPH